MKKLALLISICFLSLLINAQKYELSVNTGGGINSCFILGKSIQSMVIKPQMGFNIILNNTISFNNSSFGLGVGFKNNNYKTTTFEINSREVSFHLITVSLFFRKNFNLFYFKTGIENNLIIDKLTTPVSTLPGYYDYSLYNFDIFFETGLTFSRFNIGINLFTDILPSYRIYYRGQLTDLYLTNGVFLNFEYKLL